MMAVKNPSKYAEITSKNILKAFENISTNFIKSITFDNGYEFAKHEYIADTLKANTYFCEPYKSYQKGSIENGNKQLREWLSRDCWIDVISQQKINYRTQLVNQRPMKCLNYLTPEEVFYAKSKNLDTIPKILSNRANSLIL